MEFLRTLTLFAVLAAGFAIPLAKDVKSNTDSMIYLGTAGSKSFYSSPLPTRDWNTAKQFCSDANMQMATITRAEESELLLTVANNDTFTGGHFWSAGRDAHKHGQFVWDVNGEFVTSSIVQRFYVPIPIQTCLVYAINLVQIYDEHQPRLCSSAYGTLCMVLH